MAFVIEEEFEGSFCKFLENSGYDCPTLVDMIVQKFSGFRDEAIYNGE